MKLGDIEHRCQDCPACYSGRLEAGDYDEGCTLGNDMDGICEYDDTERDKAFLEIEKQVEILEKRETEYWVNLSEPRKE